MTFGSVLVRYCVLIKCVGLLVVHRNYDIEVRGVLASASQTARRNQKAPPGYGVGCALEIPSARNTSASL